MTTPVAILTGASRGVGRATARALAGKGFQLVLCARDEQGLAETASGFPEGAPAALLLPTDVRKSDEVRRVVDQSAERFGQVDVLINNAGVAPLAPLEGISASAFDECLAVNVSAVFHATQQVWPIMQRQRRGTIISISSFASIDPFSGFQVYGASKAWVNLFTKAIADEGRAFNIRAFSLALGTVETAMLRGLFPDFPAEQALAPEEVAELIGTLVEPGCRHASGTTLFVRR